MRLKDFSAALAVFEDTGLAFSERAIRTLITLPGHKLGEPVTLKDLAAELGYHKPSMSRTISFLVDNKLASRVTDKGDRRLILLRRTPAGTKLLRRVLSADASASNSADDL